MLENPEPGANKNKKSTTECGSFIPPILTTRLLFSYQVSIFFQTVSS